MRREKEMYMLKEDKWGGGNSEQRENLKYMYI